MNSKISKVDTDLVTRVEAIELRNNKVSSDKRWETSLTRRLSIMSLTYGTILGFLLLTGAEKPFLTALIPTLGYFLSTLLLKSIRNHWEK